MRAVVFRIQPNLTAQQVENIQEFASAQIGHGYDWSIGKVEMPVFHLDADTWCKPLTFVDAGLGSKCQMVGRVNLWLGEVEQAQERFFCSDFVLPHTQMRALPWLTRNLIKHYPKILSSSVGSANLAISGI